MKHGVRSGLFTFKGERGRLSYIGSLILVSIVTILGWIAFGIFNTDATSNSIMGSGAIALIVLWLWTMPLLIQRIRNCVETNSAVLGFFVVTWFIPFIGIIWMVYPGKEKS